MMDTRYIFFMKEIEDFSFLLQSYLLQKSSGTILDHKKAEFFFFIVMFWVF